MSATKGSKPGTLGQASTLARKRAEVATKAIEAAGRVDLDVDVSASEIKGLIWALSQLDSDLAHMERRAADVERAQEKVDQLSQQIIDLEELKIKAQQELDEAKRLEWIERGAACGHGHLADILADSLKGSAAWKWIQGFPIGGRGTVEELLNDWSNLGNSDTPNI